jgi:hypothetical protein
VDDDTPQIVFRDALLKGLDLVGGGVFVVFIVDKCTKIGSVVDLPRAVDERIDRAVGTGESADDRDIFSGGLIERFFVHDLAIGDIDGRLVSGEPLTEPSDEVGVPSGVGGVPVEDISDDGNTGPVDTETNLELLEIRPMVFAVAMRDRERLVGIFVSFVESVNGEGGGIGVKHVGRNVFASSGFDQHGPEDRAWVGVRKLVECSSKRVVVEVFGFDSLAKEVLCIGIAEELRQPIHRLPSGQTVHNQRHDPQTGRKLGAFFVPVKFLVEYSNEAAFLTDSANDRKRPRSEDFHRRTHDAVSLSECLKKLTLPLNRK